MINCDLKDCYYYKDGKSQCWRLDEGCYVPPEYHHLTEESKIDALQKKLSAKDKQIEELKQTIKEFQQNQEFDRNQVKELKAEVGKLKEVLNDKPSIKEPTEICHKMNLCLKGECKCPDNVICPL